MRATLPSGLTLFAVFLLACSQERAPEQSKDARPEAEPPAAQKPTPFDKGPVKIALVQYSNAGDYFQQWTDGARKQADAVGFTMQHYDAKAEDARQATDMKTAIGSGVAGIIVVGRRRSRTTSISPHSCSPTWRRTSAMAYLWAT
jgi:simple sugar transport system substrate-binding protein